MIARRCACALVIAVAASSCSTTPPLPPPNPLIQPTSQAELSAMTPPGLVDALDRAGLPAPHPVDTTSVDCRTAHCLQSVDTDTVRIKSFATTGQAEIFAADQRLFQLATIVVAFTPSVTPADQQRYRTEIAKLVR